MKKVLFYLSLLLVSSSAFAANIFEPVAGDKAILILSSLFGGLFNGGGDPLLAGIKMFNGCVLIIGGILAGYTIIAGTVSTAHDGVMLGKKFSSVWIPIRYSVGTALVLPVVSGGYCVMQAIVAWIITQGIGLADQVWNAYVGNAANLSSLVSASIVRPEAVQTTHKIYESLVCNEMIKYAISHADTNLNYQSKTVGVSSSTGTFGTTLSFGIQANGTGDECGSVTAKAFTMPVAPSGTGIFANIISGVQNTQRMVELNQENVNQLNTMISNLQPLAAKEVNADLQGGSPPSLSEVDAIAHQYENAMKAKASALILAMSDNHELTEAATKDGFATAGAFYIKISQIADLVNRTLTDVPTATGPTQGLSNIDSLYFGPEYEQVLQKLVSRYDQSSALAGTYGVGDMEGGSNTSWRSAIKASFSKLDPTVFAKKAFTSRANFVPSADENILMAATRCGNWVLAVAGAATAILFITNVSAGVTPGIASVLSDIVRMFVPPLMMVGGALSFWLPMTPFFIWAGALLGFFISAVMAIVAAPLWAVAHLHPSGDDLHGKGGRGYMLILSLLLRPVLMVFGMVAGIVLIAVFGQFINIIFADVFVISQSAAGFLTFIVGALFASPVLYGALVWKILTKCFSLIHYLPDEVLKWIGGGESFGHFAQDQTGYNAIKTTSQLLGGMGGAGVTNNNKPQPNNGSGNFKTPEERKLERMNDMKSGIAEAGVNEAKKDEHGEEIKDFTQMKADQVQAEMTQRTNEGIDALGGEDSKHAENFLKNVSDLKAKHPDRPIGRIMDSALNGELNQRFGRGAGGAIGQMGNGYSGDNFKEAVSTFENANEQLYNIGLNTDQRKGAITSSVVHANSEFEKHNEARKADPSIEPISYSDFVKQSLHNTVQEERLKFSV
ncbi:TPA: DotA/TraY family protein [Burkholderia vietnamiensis]|nr:DotA/TraY family protein [Burkholderia vietnamiensis]